LRVQRASGPPRSSLSTGMGCALGRWLWRRRRRLPHDLHLQLKARRRPRGGARPAGLAVKPADCVPARDPLGISHVPARNLDDDDVV
jgi:hypothetical protein